MVGKYHLYVAESHQPALLLNTIGRQNIGKSYIRINRTFMRKSEVFNPWACLTFTWLNETYS